MPLDALSLQRHTLEASNRANPRATVEHFLGHSTESYDPLPPSPLKQGHSSPPARPSLASGSRRRSRDPDQVAPETALVLHHSSSASPQPAPRLKTDATNKPKKRSLVNSMRPRLSTNPRPAAASAARGIDKDDDKGSSPVLMPRKAAKKENQSPPEQSDTKQDLNSRALSKQRERDDFDNEEEAEHLARKSTEPRLDARRERRRAKAVIVKDRTVSARATGAAAAAKLKSRTNKGKEKKHDSDSDEEEEDDEQVEPKRRKTRHEKTRAAVQSVTRPPNLGNTRLTIRPNKLGLFAKGVTSGRTKVKPGNPLPDLAFSELDFLNAPRPERSPSPSTASSSSPPPSPPRKRTRATTSGSKAPVADAEPTTKARKVSAPPSPPAPRRSTRTDASTSKAPTNPPLKPKPRSKPQPDASPLSLSKAAETTSTEKKRKPRPTFAIIVPPHPATSSSGKSAYSLAKKQAAPLDASAAAAIAQSAQSPRSGLGTPSSRSLPEEHRRAEGPLVLDTTSAFWGAPPNSTRKDSVPAGPVSCPQGTAPPPPLSPRASAEGAAPLRPASSQASTSTLRGTVDPPSALARIDRLIRECDDHLLEARHVPAFQATRGAESKRTTGDRARHQRENVGHKEGFVELGRPFQYVEGSEDPLSSLAPEEMEREMEVLSRHVGMAEEGRVEGVARSFVPDEEEEEGMGMEVDYDDQIEGDLPLFEHHVPTDEARSSRRPGKHVDASSPDFLQPPPQDTPGFVHPASFLEAEAKSIVDSRPAANGDLDDEDDRFWDRDPSSLGLDELDVHFGGVAWDDHGGDQEEERGGMHQMDGVPSSEVGEFQHPGQGMDAALAAEMKQHWYKVQV